MTDHPRLCGEKVSGKRVCKNIEGSPPPMRGKGQFASMSGRYQGITPAYAGKRETPKGCVEQGGDHPRLCGEKACVLQRHFQAKGSPPPMRGKATSW